MTIASEIDSIERFSDPEKLKSYAGLVPSVCRRGTSWPHNIVGCYDGF
ncbi:MAG: Transposase [Cenarchaeum symbiont of Oopsacas minuta]|nr:Transposase [Cenarchaeum symbiont of Oopsacas minuta]